MRTPGSYLTAGSGVDSQHRKRVCFFFFFRFSFRLSAYYVSGRVMVPLLVETIREKDFAVIADIVTCGIITEQRHIYSLMRGMAWKSVNGERGGGFCLIIV